MLNKQDKKKIDYQGKINACKLVEDLIKTKGWTEVLEPLLNAMIEDVTGRKKGNVWVCGWIHQNKEKALGYQEALVTFYNRVIDYGSSRQELEESLIATAKPKTFVTPMQRSKYRENKEKI